MKTMIATTSHLSKTTFTTCRTCGYIISDEQELCDACKNKDISSNYTLFLWME